jgi:hypothetical protein
MALGAKTDIADNTGNSPLFLLLHRIVNEYDKFIDVLIEMDRSNKIAMDSNSIQFVNNLLRGGVDSYTPRGRIASLLSKYVAPTPLAQQPVELANPMPSVGGFGKTRSKKQRVTRRSKRM